ADGDLPVQRHAPPRGRGRFGHAEFPGTVWTAELSKAGRARPSAGVERGQRILDAAVPGQPPGPPGKGRPDRGARLRGAAFVAAPARALQGGDGLALETRLEHP